MFKTYFEVESPELPSILMLIEPVSENNVSLAEVQVPGIALK